MVTSNGFNKSNYQRDLQFKGINRQDILPSQYTGTDKAKMEKIIMREMDLPNNASFYGLTSKSKGNGKLKSITPMNVSTANYDKVASQLKNTHLLNNTHDNFHNINPKHKKNLTMWDIVTLNDTYKAQLDEENW